MLHETSWDRPAMLSLNHSPKEIERLQEKLDGRGGSKKENVYDVIKHMKKKMRVNAVLDQRANSIADLAAVLIDQEDIGVRTQQSRLDEAEKGRARDAKIMLRLSKEFEKGGMEKIEARRAELMQKLESPADAIEAAERNVPEIQHQLSALDTKSQRMRLSVDAVAEASQKVSKSLPEAQQQDQILAALPGFPANPASFVPRRGPLRARFQRENAPIFSTAGIVVKWANQLDAEYAEAWPETIDHQPMGLARHRAPRAHEEAVMDVAGFRSKLEAAWDKTHPQTPPVAPSREAAHAEVDEPTRAAMEKARRSVLSEVKKAVAQKTRSLSRKAGAQAPRLERVEQTQE